MTHLPARSSRWSKLQQRQLHGIMRLLYMKDAFAAQQRKAAGWSFLHQLTNGQSTTARIIKI